MAITAADVKKAFVCIKKNGFAPNKESTKWDIIDPITLERFPPKAVLRVAKKIANDKSSTGGGGWPTNDPLVALGFEIVLKVHLEKSDEAEDINAVSISENNETTRKRLINARLGQGSFREALLEIWKEKCAVTGCDIKEVLRASHIKPWRHSNDRERLDPANGILLVASLDALFDSYLITFSEIGTMLVASPIRKSALTQLGIPAGKHIPFPEKTKTYLIAHRLKFKTTSSRKSFVW